jgi:hypothetical protein
MTDAPKLMPCPFCGSKAKAARSTLIIGAYEVRCKDGHINGLIWERKSDAIAEWNHLATRAEEARK